MKIKAKDNKIFIIWRVDDNNLPRFKREVIDRISSLLPEEKIKTCTLVQEDPKIVAQNKLAFRQLRAHLAPNSIPAEPSREPTAGASNSAALHDIIRDLYAAHHPYAWAREIWANPQEVTTQGPPLALSKQLTGIPSARKGKPDLLSDGHV
ncbi:hypothetical protein PSTG_07663 [Puccinia striiformis f. sp. tritici PST-78]|uniref:Uncharacterized protein n=1 Tax=Puccinia striiformis f. sp. tritici PST-78 TaxID=1165861 RepID=A0A0L0VIA3_9BASI|nr:hypothetical protein PSTG_07663 [Puccinia striiformis f. sp. tritici PST-78]